MKGNDLPHNLSIAICLAKGEIRNQIFKLFDLATNCGIFYHKTFFEKKINMSKQGTVIDCNESYSSAH